MNTLITAFDINASFAKTEIIHLQELTGKYAIINLFPALRPSHDNILTHTQTDYYYYHIIIHHVSDPLLFVTVVFIGRVCVLG